MPDRAYISVITSAPQQVQAYLYSTAETILTMKGAPNISADYTGVLIAVESNQNPEHARYTAEYQARRLNSGLHGAKVHASFKDAQAHLTASLVAGKHTATGYVHPELLQAARVQTRAPQSNVSRSR